MDSNEKRVQKHVALNSRGEESEGETERQGGDPKSGLSRSTIIVVAILPVTAIAVVLY